MSSHTLSVCRSGFLRSALHIKSKVNTEASTSQVCLPYQRRRITSCHRELSRPYSNIVNITQVDNDRLISANHVPSSLVTKSSCKPLPVGDSYLLCNHDLELCTSSTAVIDRFTPCGRCDVLGSCDSSWSTGGFRSPGASSPTLSRYRSFLATSPGDTNWLVLRSFHTTHRPHKDESKAELTVKALKDEAKQKTESDAASSTMPVSTAAVDEPAPVAPAVPVKKSIKERIVAEVKHYYHGFRLLFVDVKVCVRLLVQVLNAKSLTRRERRQLVRTTADLFRLVPFLVFVVVPFMEFLLPVALKLFPGMLPSTFAVATKEQEKLRKKLKVKLEMAKFLQDTIEETALQRKGAKGESVQEFVNFMERVRTTGLPTTNEEIIKYSKLFDEDITLDNLNYGQLRALMKLLDLPAVGTSNFLRFNLRMKLRQLEADDRMIMKEGMDSMAVWELQEACRARGMRGLGVPKERLRDQLQQWLDLHLTANIPTSLLLLSRTLYLSETLSTEEQLKATISSLPESTAEEAKVKISEVTGDRVDHKTKVDIIKQEEEAIKLEKAEEEAKRAEEEAKRAEEEAKRAEEEAKRVEEEAKRAEEEVLVDTAETFREPLDIVKEVAEPITPSVVDSAPELTMKPEEILVDKAEILEAAETETKVTQEISQEELEVIEDVLESVAENKSPNIMEHEDLETLKEDVSEYNETLADLKEVVLSSGTHDELIETKSAKRLSKKVNNMVVQMAAIMSELNEEKSQIIEDIEIKEVKMKRSSELKADKVMRENMMEQISEKKRAVVSINELVLAMRRIQKVPDDTKLQRIAQVLDEDRDGVIDVNDAHKVIELLGQENVSVEPERMKDIMDLLRREEQVELQEKEEKIREKIEKQAKQSTETPGGEQRNQTEAEQQKQ